MTAIDVFMCVHRRDVGYLFELALRSYLRNFEPKGTLMLVTNDQPFLAEFIANLGLADVATVTSDNEWLSQRELMLPGWYRQQIIKLRAYEFCTTEHFCNLGADTVLLQPITSADLIADDFPVLYYRRHRVPNPHILFEYQRVTAIGHILKTHPWRAYRYGDFISDLFCFDRATMQSLNVKMQQLYGSEPYHTVLHGLGSGPENYNKFGEWTLYSVYLLDCLKLDLTMRNAAAGFLYQAHSERDFRRYRFDSKVVHFVSKDFDLGRIESELGKRGILRGTPLLSAAIQEPNVLL